MYNSDVLTIDQAKNALSRALDTVGLEDKTRVPLENQYDFELWYEVRGEALEQREKEEREQEASSLVR